MQKIILPLIDALIAFTLWLAAIGLRTAFGDSNTPDVEHYWRHGVLLSSLTIFSFSRHGLYDLMRFRSSFNELLTVLRANLIAVLMFIVLGYFFAEQRISRGTLLIYILLSCCSLTLERLAVRAGLIFKFTARNIKKIVLVGNGDPLREYIRTALERPHLDIQIIGWIDPPEWHWEYRIPIYAESEPNKSDGQSPMAYVISYQSDQYKKIDSFLSEKHNDLIPIFVLPNLHNYALLGLRMADFAGLPILVLNQPQVPTIDLLLKRLIDVVGASIGLVLLSPLFIVVSIIVKATSPGPIFFCQERMGFDGRTFRMWKFRSMHVSLPGPGWTVENDPRRTWFGKFIRTTSIDELPQLWNVLIGDMSLVGPRPEQPYYVASFKQEIPAYMLRHKVKCGITGWAQVNGWRGNTSLHKRIEYDLYYIKNFSISFDIKIILLTLWKGLVNKNAY